LKIERIPVPNKKRELPIVSIAMNQMEQKPKRRYTLA